VPWEYAVVPDDIEAAVTEALDFIENWIAGFTTRATNPYRHFPVGMLARSIACLRGIQALSGVRDDLSGVLFRGSIEADILGLYALLGGAVAQLELLGDHRRHVETFISRMDDEDLSEAIAGWITPKATVVVERVAEKLGPMLEAEGELVSDAQGIYDSMYRHSSTFDVHPVGASFRYSVVDGEILRFETSPGPVGLTPKIHLSLGTLYTTYFAGYAFQKSGYGTSKIDALLARLGEVLEESPEPTDRGSEI
jgi:hypothetical protein